MDDDELMRLQEGITQLRKGVVRLESKIESKMEQLQMDVRNVIQTELESFRIKMIQMLNEMFVKRDDVIISKHDPTKMIDSESVVQMNDFNQSKEESEAEIEVGVQAIRDIKIEDTVVKDQVQVEELTKFEENGKLQVRLDGDKADSVEQADQIRNHEVTSNISHIINTCEEYEKTGLMVLVTGNKLIAINDPYVFRLLVMGQLSHDISIMGLDFGLCQVEKASEDMLIQLYSFVSEKSNAKIKELLLKDQYIKYMGHLNIDDNGIVVASSWSNDSVTESNPRANGPVSGGDWRSAIDVFGFIKALAGFVVNDIIQGTTKRLESLHPEEVLMNKKSFEYARLLDKLKVECGVTIDIALWKFEATKYYGFVTDALEHPNLIKSMIFGIFRTNCVVFIIESTTVGFEAGNSKDGQNHEHALIVFTLGMKQMIGCCNKMDATTKKYSKTVYGETVKEKPSYLKKVTILDKIPFIPISDFEDDNMIERSPLFSNLILYISCKSMIKTEELMLVKANSKVWLASLSAWAIIVNQHVIIKLGLVYKPFVIAFTTPMIENKDFDQKLVDVGSSVLAREFIFDKDVVNNKAKTFDEKHLFMSIVIVKVVSVYQNIGLFEKISISTTMVNDKVNEKFQVSKKTNPALRAAEQKISKVGFVIIKNCYVWIAASWITDTFNKAVKTTSDLGVCYFPSFVLRGLVCSAIVALQFFHAMYAKRCIILVVATVLLFILFQPPLSSSWASRSNHIKVAPQSADGISINDFMASNSTWMSLLLILASLLSLASVTSVITIKYMVQLMKVFCSFALGIVLGVYISAEFFLQVAMLHAFIIVTMACASVFVVYTHFPSASAQSSYHGCCSSLGSIFSDFRTFHFFIFHP